MKLNTLTAVAAAACMTVGSAVFADPNNLPTKGNDVNGTGVNGASHGQPNTTDQGGAMVPDGVNGANPTGVNAKRAMMNGMSGDSAAAAMIESFKANPDTAGDKLFALEAGAGNMWEVQFAKLEQQKGSSDQVKQLAAQIERDHAQAEQKLEPIASKLGVMIPQALPPEKQAKLDLFAALPPEQLDKVYLSSNKADHLRDVNVYADHAKMLKDSDLKQYAQDTLPKLREHTAMIIKQNETNGMPAETSFTGSGNGMSMNQ